MAKTVGHSKLPWEVITTIMGISIRRMDGYKVAVEIAGATETERKANAEFICKAVNNHDRLLEASKEALKVFDAIRSNRGETGKRIPVVLNLQAAIQAVEEGE
ncbi:MAG: hypothetical protein V3R78_10010 [Thermodesulfobacteriota bacterium]